MSINQNVLGLIFASINDSAVIDLTKLRTMGSIPYGGRYRTVDFPLSNMVNSGISEVGVITKSNYGSLLDHLGSGREWDLARKKAVCTCSLRSARLAAVLIRVVWKRCATSGALWNTPRQNMWFWQTAMLSQQLIFLMH